MKVGGYRKAVAGFTIIETLIVLAVSAMLVMSAIILISGRTDKTQFLTATNDLRQQIQQTINETASGYFPNANNFTCTANAIVSIPTLTNGSQQQGTNGGCVFLGKAMQFGDPGQTDKYIVYAVTGNRLQAGTKTEVTTLTQAWPEAVAQGNSFNNALTGVTITQPLQSGLTVSTMRYTKTDGTIGNTSAFALLSSLASYSSVATGDCSGVCSGSQGLALYAIASSSVNTTTSRSLVDIMDGQGAANSATNYIAAKKVTVCLNSGTTSQSVVYTIGSNGDAQAVDMQVQSGSCT
jgi:type II secretory pathway pseudopilin PulG